jgi:hypothetical protein
MVSTANQTVNNLLIDLSTEVARYKDATDTKKERKGSRKVDLPRYLYGP